MSHRYHFEDDPYGAAIMWPPDRPGVRVVVRPYAFGQYRIQLEIVRADLPYPEILSPEC